jgi:hypothetical protein
VHPITHNAELKTAGGLRSLPIRCDLKHAHGIGFCLYRCPMTSSRRAFEVRPVDATRGLPPAETGAIDVVALDMNAGWPNLGFDSMLFAVRDAVCDLAALLEGKDLRVRVLTVDVRGEAFVPQHEPGRIALYISSGGPGHIDPRLNDGASPISQGVLDDLSWEAPLGRLFEDVLADEGAAFLAICHSFGLLYRHLGQARIAVRGPEKGGKSSGQKEIALTPEALAHPWFARLARGAVGARFRALDSRLCDLLPPAVASETSRYDVLAYETLEPSGERGDAVTLVEFARDRGGVMPRVYGTNFHPEVVGRDRFRTVLEERRASGRTTEEWYQERLAMLEQAFPLDGDEGPLLRTSDLTFLGPLRFHLYRQVRERLEALGHDPGPLHEQRVLGRTP